MAKIELEVDDDLLAHIDKLGYEPVKYAPVEKGTLSIDGVNEDSPYEWGDSCRTSYLHVRKKPYIVTLPAKQVVLPEEYRDWQLDLNTYGYHQCRPMVSYYYGFFASPNALTLGWILLPPY